MPECRMPTHSLFADAQAPSQAASGSTVNALYRAALGPVQQPRYLALFEGFDQAGRAPVGWNLAASLATLNWMLLHHLWTAALVYVALVEGLALLIFGVGRPLLHWPEQVEWGLIAAFALFAIVLPGLFGDALLYSEIRKRMARALVAAHSIPEACNLLARQASSWRRLVWIAVANGVLFVTIAAAWLWVPEGDWRAGRPTDAQVASGPVQSASKMVLPANVPASAPTLGAEPRAIPASAATVAASAPEDLTPPKADETAPAQASVRNGGAGPTRVPDVATPGPTQSERSPAAALAPPTASASSQDAAPAARKAPAAPAKRRVTEKTAPKAPTSMDSPALAAASASTPASSAAAPRETASTPAPATTPKPPALGSAPGYYLNVGLFSEEANARRAQAKLLNVGLPAFRQTFNTKNGERTRVRVGPFASEADAQKAATQIRSLQLDALMYRQRG